MEVEQAVKQTLAKKQLTDFDIYQLNHWLNSTRASKDLNVQGLRLKVVCRLHREEVKANGESE